MSTTYNYSVQEAFPNHKVDGAALTDELTYDYHFEPGFSVEVFAATVNITFPEALTDEQKATLDLAVSLHQGDPKPFAALHFEQEYEGAHVVRSTWWSRRNTQTGDLSVKVEEHLYTYDNGRLMLEVEKMYERDGSVVETNTWKYEMQTSGTTRIVRKVEL